MTSVERLDSGPLRVGSQARIKQPGQSERVWTVTEFTPHQRFVWTAKASGYAMRAEHVLAPTAGGGTTNLLRLELNGPLAGLIGGSRGRQIRKTLATENDGFRRAAITATETPARPAQARSGL